MAAFSASWLLLSLSACWTKAVSTACSRRIGRTMIDPWNLPSTSTSSVSSFGEIRSAIWDHERSSDDLLVGKTVAPCPCPAALPNTTTNINDNNNSPAGASTLPLTFCNYLVDVPVYGYLTGWDGNNRLVMLKEDGNLYYPTATSQQPVAIPEDAKTTLNLTDRSTKMTLPTYVAGARLWFSRGRPLRFFVTNSGLVEPSCADADDPSYDIDWGFVEFTFQGPEYGGIFINLSFVDFLGLPLGIKLIAAGNVTQHALGPHRDAKEEVCAKLRAQMLADGQPWDLLCVRDGRGRLIRIISPQMLISLNESAFEAYFDEYVDAVWTRFNHSSLTVNAGPPMGDVQCNVAGDLLVCDGDNTPFTKPNSADVFSCSSGPFVSSGNGQHLTVLACICAAFNRATLLLGEGNVQPHLPPLCYYRTPVTNFYSRFVHEVEADAKGYAFSYDDVTADRELYNSAGVLAAASPEELVIFIGGWDRKAGT